MPNYKTPNEIVSEYPDIAEIWTATQLGYLLHLKLVGGYKTRRSSKLNVDDVLKIFNIRKDNERELHRF